MTDQEKIIALAKLDGKDLNDGTYCLCPDCAKHGYGLGDYLTSYDAIIPLIQKQDRETWDKMRKILMQTEMEEYCFVLATPSELADALLKAKNLL